MNLVRFTVVFSILLFASFAPSPSFARELQVGVSPLRVDLGEIPAGSEKYASFSLVTQAPEEILVRLGAMPANRDIYIKPENAYISNTSSDADASGWVVFPANPVVILPLNQSLQTAAGSVGGWRSVGFTVRVPDDAEPCNYAFQIKPTPYVAVAYDTGVSIAAITVVTAHLKVPGNCVRDGAILDIQQGQAAGGSVGIDTYFKNTGSATLLARASDVKIYDTNGTEVASSAGGAQLIRPGSAAVFTAYFPIGAIEPGKTYKATSTVSYGTGSKTKSAILVIEYTTPPAQAAALAGTGWAAYLSKATMLILIIVILAVSYFIYKRE